MMLSKGLQQRKRLADGLVFISVRSAAELG